MNIEKLIKAWQATKKIKGHAAVKSIEGYGDIIRKWWNSGLSLEKYVALTDPENRTHNRDRSMINDFLYWAQVNGFLKGEVADLYKPNRWISKYMKVTNGRQS